MKRNIRRLFVYVFGSGVLFSACEKSGFNKEKDDFGNEYPVLILESGYASRVVILIEQPADFQYYKTSLIEYSRCGNVLATINYGNGTKDIWAKKTKDGKTGNVALSAKKDGCGYTKVITKPLVKTEVCDYIVEATIKYFKGKEWVATVDYGDGNCDVLATKT